MLDLIVPLIMAAVAVAGLAKKQDVYTLLCDGAADGLKILARIAPNLIILLAAVQMLRASGAMDAFAAFLAPAFSLVGIPPQCAPLVLLRPFSGSAALAIGADLIGTYGADSLIGRTAAVMLGSTETTFYTISVYFGAAGVRKTRHAVPAALAADAVGFIASALTCRLLWRA